MDASSTDRRPTGGPHPDAAPPALSSPAAPAAASPAPRARMILVPRGPRPVVDLDGPPEAGGDELDALVDEMFGPASNEAPGPFDAVLLVAGVALLAWATLSGAGGLVPWLAWTAIILGAVLPARSVVAVVQRRRRAGRLRAAAARGYLIDAGHPATAALVDAYADLLVSSRVSGSIHAARTVEAGHQALIEVASLLDGGPPLVAAQEEFVGRRTAAIKRLTARLGALEDERKAAEEAAAAAAGQRVRRRAAAVTVAREELQAEAGEGSVEQLERLARGVGRERGDEDA